MSFNQAQFESLTSDIVYSATFVPYSQSRNAGKWESINWFVSLSVGKQTLTTDYGQGIGHFPQREIKRIIETTNGLPLFRQQEVTKEATRVAIETQVLRPVKADSVMGYVVDYSTNKGTKLKPPCLADVLYSLIQDASAIDYATFEKWASDYGYNTDSREAEKTYRACLEIGLKLRSMLRNDRLEQLRELFQDY